MKTETYINLTKLGQLYAVNARDVGGWLKGLSLRHDDGRPTREAMQQGLVQERSLEYGGCFWHWHQEKTCAILDGMGYIVKVIDRDYCSSKAMKWAVGQFFPGLGLWKLKKVPSVLPPITLAEFALMCGVTQQEELNSLLRQQSAETGEKRYLHLIRPPPTALGA